MRHEDFQILVNKDLECLFAMARSKDEMSFIYSILGIDSGCEDAGWQPIDETFNVIQDLIGIVNAPFKEDTKIRIALLLYCHVIEANFIYHCLYNMLLTVQGELPNTFNFLRLYKNGIPPSVSNKRKEIVEKAKLQGFPNIECMFSEIVRIDIRNAFFHSDYIIYNNELRLKHRGSEYKKIPAQEVFSLLNKTLHFFDKFMNLLHEGRRSFPIGYKITGRKDSKGNILSSVNLLVDEKTGVLTGFSTSDPLPLW